MHVVNINVGNKTTIVSYPEDQRVGVYSRDGGFLRGLLFDNSMSEVGVYLREALIREGA